MPMMVHADEEVAIVKGLRRRLELFGDKDNIELLNTREQTE